MKDKYTYRQLIENLSKLTNSQLDQQVLTSEKHDYGYYVNNICGVFDILDGDPLQLDKSLPEGTVLLHIPRKI